MSGQPYVATVSMEGASLRKRKRLLLERLDIELTERCNNNCIHCCINLPADHQAAKERELSGAQIKDILRQAVSLGCMKVRFTGGEPFIRGDFEELYIFARRQGMRVLIFTNATLINAHLAELFSRTPPLERIEVTVYGMSKDSYESATRTRGSFDAARQGIDLLLKKNIPFTVKQALLPSNKSEIDEFESWATGVRWMDKPPLHSMFFDLSGRRDEEKNRLIRTVRIKPEEGVRILTRNKGRYLKEMKEFCYKFMRPSGKRLFSCGAGMGRGCVDAYGNFQPCITLRHPGCVYDLRKGSLSDAMVNFFPVMRNTKARNPDYLKRCARCFLKGLCEQCPAKSWAEYGTLDTPVGYFCEIAHAQARFLGLLKDGEMGWEVAQWRERVIRFCRG